MPRYRVTLGIRRHAVRRLAGAGAGRFGAGPADRGDRQVLRRDGVAARGGPHGCRRACAGPGRALRPWARAWPVDTVRAAVNFHLKPDPIAMLDCAVVADDFDARFSADGAPLPLSHPGAPGPARARSRPGVVGAAADCDAEAMREGADRWSAGTTSRRSAPPAARPSRRSRRSIAWRSAAGGEEIHIAASARSFLHNQVRSMVGSLKLVGEGKWRAGRSGSRPRGARPGGLRAGRSGARPLSRARRLRCAGGGLQPKTAVEAGEEARIARPAMLARPRPAGRSSPGRASTRLELMAALEDQAGGGDHAVGALPARQARASSRCGRGAPRWCGGTPRTPPSRGRSRWRSRAIRRTPPCARRGRGSRQSSWRVKKTVRGNCSAAQTALVETRPAPLRGLNCIGSASLKGASLAGASVMILASRGNFKRPCSPGMADRPRLCADEEPRCRWQRSSRHDWRARQECRRNRKFPKSAIERPPACRNGRYTRTIGTARSNTSLGY